MEIAQLTPSPDEKHPDERLLLLDGQAEVQKQSIIGALVYIGANIDDQ